ncbi:Sugar kinase of the NBD/HSP70 family, may contain an N-terminal HTH domain [Vreelandella subterranea]|uniref:Sugar kinase of the NBD/HSP70 family, may contain an N-terminal HTH domain n=1 Tax=Vreelandella subterranea TaxID=416874 RepID=A0A1H9P2N7_9GAMM|nr:ROK family transcriptional regulator [Halomonas subterranea]SER42452.1 Sugar kinase of the NBD/HSP70 family, may contain an N-terminal HTH domain [Halomonas subterranea]
MALPSTDTSRHDNTLAVIRTLRDRGPAARVDLGTLNGISSATVTSISAELLQQGLITERPPEAPRPNGRGRPKTLIELAPNAACVVCVKLSINEIQLVVGDFAGQVRHSEHHTVSTLTLNADDLEALLEDKISALCTRQLTGFQRLAGICLAVQGVVSSQSGTIIWSPALSFRNAPISARLAKRFHCSVLLENDANCIASLLAAQPAYADCPNLVVIMLGYGIGMSVLISGVPFLGANGSAAEFGHSKYQPDGALCACGRRGCIEAYASDYALYRAAADPLELPVGDSAHPSEQQMQALTQLALHGNPVAKRIYAEAGRALGVGIANVLALFNPDLVLITGSGVRGFDAMQTAMHGAIDNALVAELRGTTRIESCAWDRDMTCMGGIAIALNATDSQTLLDSQTAREA